MRGDELELVLGRDDLSLMISKYLYQSSIHLFAMLCDLAIQVLSCHASPAFRYKQIRRNKTSSGNCMPM
jgi:hypothetical protein